MTKASEPPEAVDYRDCIVTFIDILGFREIVTNKSPEEIGEFVKLVQRHAGAGQEKLAELERAGQEIPWTRTIFFSDSVVRVRPYDCDYHDGSLFHECYDLVLAQAELAHRGIFVRGGLTVGKMYHRENTLFGPAMVRAYDLESRFANYPRIVIDPNALSALKEDERLKKQDHDTAEEQDYVRDLLRQGDDRLYFIDYLGAFEAEMDEPIFYSKFLAEVKKQVVTNAKAMDRNFGVLQKYLWLADYANKTAAERLEAAAYKRFEIGPQDIPALATL